MAHCWCGRLALVKTSWTDANPGRRFYACPQNPSNCSFIGWIDPPLCSRARDIIPGLLRSKNLVEAKSKENDVTIWKLKVYLIATWVMVFVYLIC